VPCLEKLADSGGVCVSEKVFEEVEGKLELGFETDPRWEPLYADPRFRDLLAGIGLLERPPRG
jgi:hypothetical protein